MQLTFTILESPEPTECERTQTLEATKRGALIINREYDMHIQVAVMKR